MRRIDRLLAPGEHVHLVSREHPVVLVAPFLWASVVIAACGVIAVRVARSGVVPPLRMLAAAVCGAVAVRAFAGLVRAVARWQARTLVVTDRRIVLHRSALPRRIDAVPLDAVHALEIVRSGPGRALHYGGLIVTTGGRRDLLLGLRQLPDPDLLFALLLGLADDLPGAAPMPSWRLARGALPVAAG